MPDLVRSLQGRDLGHLRIVAQLWGIELKAPDARLGLQRLAPQLLDSELLDELVNDLPDRARLALNDLLQSEGRLSWALFTRRHGELREMGPGRRDRERPYSSDSASACETLWYRALIGREFFDTPTGPEEFAYIPDDLIPLLPLSVVQGSVLLGRQASPAERTFPIPANDSILDDTCTLLAGLRMDLSLEEIASHLVGIRGDLPYPAAPETLKAFLTAADLLDEEGRPMPEPTRTFLGKRRDEGLAFLTRAWLRSASFNELQLLPSLHVQGEWRNDPQYARQAVLDFLFTIPGSPKPHTGATEESQDAPANETIAEAPYWSLAAFLEAVRQERPDFQRPAGDYDSWHIQDRESGDFLRGFPNWDAVDGELVRYIIAGPLHWLGIMDMASPAAPVPGKPAQISAFRFSSKAADLLERKAPGGLISEDEQIVVQSDGSLRTPPGVPRTARYQVARFCIWQGMKDGNYRYRLTPASLMRAREQGLKVAHLLKLLSRYAVAVPPSLVQSVNRWETHGSQARLERLMVLRLRDARIMEELRNSRAARFLGDPLGPAAIVVKPGAWEKVLSALAELGYLGEVDDELSAIKNMPEQPLS